MSHGTPPQHHAAAAATASPLSSSPQPAFVFYLVRQPRKVLLHHGVVEPAADEALDGAVRKCGRADRSAPCVAPHQDLAAFQERHHRRRQGAAVPVGDAYRPAGLHDGDRRVGCAEVDADDHLVGPVCRGLLLERPDAVPGGHHGHASGAADGARPPRRGCHRPVAAERRVPHDHGCRTGSTRVRRARRCGTGGEPRWAPPDNKRAPLDDGFG
eukprot:226478-Chlamydomonas_euryale.AAC.5